MPSIPIDMDYLPYSVIKAESNTVWKYDSIIETDHDLFSPDALPRRRRERLDPRVASPGRLATHVEISKLMREILYRR